jgi:hypothetical protein
LRRHHDAGQVAIETPEIRRKILLRLDIMQREMKHIQVAMTALKHALLAEKPSSRPLADATMNSRNWVLSVAMSHAFIQAMLEPDKPHTDPYMTTSRGTISALGDLFSDAINEEFRTARGDLYPRPLPRNMQRPIVP